MIWAVVALAAVSVVLAAVVVAPWLTLRRLRARPVLVELSDGRTVEGLHVRHSARWVTLTAARTFGADGAPASIDGNIHIPRGQIAWIIDGYKP